MDDPLLGSSGSSSSRLNFPLFTEETDQIGEKDQHDLFGSLSASPPSEQTDGQREAVKAEKNLWLL